VAFILMWEEKQKIFHRSKV